MNDDKTDFRLTVSVHPEAGMDDLPHSGITWGTLIAPGLALLAAPPPGPAAALQRPQRLLAAPPTPTPATLLDAPILRTYHLSAPHSRFYLAMQADLTDWILPRRVEVPGPDEPFEDDAAALADQILSECRAPDLSWLDQCGKARTELAAAPRPYPFLIPPAPADAGTADGRRRHDPFWLRVLSAAAGRHSG